MDTIWLEDERTGIYFEFQAIWEWEDVGIGHYEFWGHREYDEQIKKVIKEIDLSDWDVNDTGYQEVDQIKSLGEQFLEDNFSEIERKLYEKL